MARKRATHGYLCRIHFIGSEGNLWQCKHLKKLQSDIFHRLFSKARYYRSVYIKDPAKLFNGKIIRFLIEIDRLCRFCCNHKRIGLPWVLYKIIDFDGKDIFENE